MISGRVIGLTGGIGSGKSTVSVSLAQRGFTVIDADEVTRLVHRDPDLCLKLEARFGADVIDRTDPVHPVVNRKNLGQMVFSSDENRSWLNQCMLPMMYNRVLTMIQATAGRVVLDAALLFEAGWDALVDNTIVVVCPMNIRVERIQKRDGLPVSQIYQRISSQMTDRERIQKSDYIIYNVDSQDCINRQLDHLLR